ncbi:MAG: hypothetical protein Crog4KO_23920 [Crocinitomicaceae bacterium]
MKKLLGINLLIAFAIIFASCGTNNNVVSNRLISKRKFNKGFHFNSKGNTKSSNEKKQEESIAFDDSKKRSEKAESNSLRTSKKSQEKKEVVSEEVAEVQEYEYTEPTPDVRQGNGLTSDELNDSGATIDNASPGESKEDLIQEERQETKHNKRASKKHKNNKKSNSSDDAMFILIVILTILIPPLGVAIYTNIDWMKVLICLLLTLLFFLPGMIYGLLVVFDVI